MERTWIVFPTIISEMIGVMALEVGVRNVWIRYTNGQRKALSRKLFTDEELAVQGNGLAFRAVQLAHGAMIRQLGAWRDDQTTWG